MKLFQSTVLYIFLFVLTINSAALASSATISGSVYFDCSFNSTYMEKHGYVLIEKNMQMKDFKVDRYAASDAEVVIQDHNASVLGTGKTDIKGNFSITVPETSNYRLIIRFHDRETEQTVSSSDAADIIVSLGYFDTETVGNWVPSPPPTYCYSCDIRYLESKKGR